MKKTSKVEISTAIETQIPVYKPSLDGNEKLYVSQCLDEGWISSKGRFVSEFEDRFGEYIGANHVTTVCNGTVALHLALLGLGITRGDEVIVPTFTYIASVNSISHCGAIPVFVDSLRDSWQIDPWSVEQAITPRTKAIMAVHLYGQPCEMDELRAIAKKYRLFLIEDCAEAFGSTYKSRHVGTFGDVATFSFFGNKTITTGEGGMVVAKDPKVFETVKKLKGQGLSGDREYWHDVIGYNYRLTNIQAALGLAQLERADEILARKALIAQWYRERLESTSLELHSPCGDVEHSFWMVSVLAETESQRDELRQSLGKRGIETRPTFYPAHTMPMYSALPKQKFFEFPVAEELSSRGMNLPSYPLLSEGEVDDICAVLRTNITADAYPVMV